MLLASYIVGRRKADRTDLPKYVLYVSDALLLDENCTVEFALSGSLPTDKTDNCLVITYVDIESTCEYDFIFLSDLPPEIVQAIRSGELTEIHDQVRNISVTITPDNLCPPAKSLVHSRQNEELMGAPV